jgi:hypothetical protein
MWKKYRTMAGMPPTDGWKTAKANANGLVMPQVKMPEAGGAKAAQPAAGDAPRPEKAQD